MQHVGLCGFREAARCDGVQIPLRQHDRRCALWTVKSLSLPGFNGYITCLQVVFQNILLLFVPSSSRTLTTDKLPVEECLWYSVFLHASKMSSPSELALDEQSFNDLYLAKFKYSSVWYSVLPRDTTDLSEAFKMELVKFFSHDGGTRSKKSIGSTADLYTPIFVLWLIA